jgi:hypothetical protein
MNKKKAVVLPFASKFDFGSEACVAGPVAIFVSGTVAGILGISLKCKFDKWFADGDTERL